MDETPPNTNNAASLLMDRCNDIMDKLENDDNGINQSDLDKAHQLRDKMEREFKALNDNISVLSGKYEKLSNDINIKNKESDDFMKKMEVEDVYDFISDLYMKQSEEKLDGEELDKLSNNLLYFVNGDDEQKSMAINLIKRMNKNQRLQNHIKIKIILQDLELKKMMNKNK